MSADPTHLYKQSLLENAPPIKITRLLYEKALVHLERARRLDPRKDGRQFNEAIGKADAIVVELRLSLDHGPAPDISGSLEKLYLFCEEQLMNAMADRSIESLAGVTNVLSNLLGAWRAVEVETQRGKAA
jgi:flagellar secretion chaperone FliS